MSQLNPKLNLKLESFFEEVKIKMHQLADEAERNANHNYKNDPFENLSEKFNTLPRVIEGLTKELEKTGNESLRKFNEKLMHISKIEQETAMIDLREKIMNEIKIILQKATKQMFNK